MYDNFGVLKGETLTKVETDNCDYIKFETKSGRKFRMVYHQDCCASCSIEDINGSLTDLLGDEILEAYESTNSDEPRDSEYPSESFTWTFYHIRTAKTTVSIRWYGESNGYYSESASFDEIT